MINSVNNTIQTIQPSANVLFNANNVITTNCNSCKGWLYHNLSSGLFTLTKPGIYKIHFNANIAATVTSTDPLILNITEAGESIIGGQMEESASTVGLYQNVSASVLVKVPCNTSIIISVKNNTSTNPITLDNPSLIIIKEC